MEIPVKPFREIRACDLAAQPLQEELRARGYALIRGLMPLGDLHPLLGEITQIAYDAGWLLPGHSPLERLPEPSAACGEPDPGYKRTNNQVFCLESFHDFAHHPELRRAMSLLVGPRLLIHPKPICRLVFPNCERFTVRAHQDHTAIDGDPESFTAWMPLHDCMPESGALQILEASHLYGLQKTPVGTGYIPAGSARGGDWVGGQINAGDVLIFHSLTVHAATPNISLQLRVSMDCRFQDAARPINPAELVFPGAAIGGRSWATTYANWRSEELKYYWKRIPLEFKPSRAELALLAQSADSEMMRARFARILTLLESEIPSRLQ